MNDVDDIKRLIRSQGWTLSYGVKYIDMRDGLCYMDIYQVQRIDREPIAKTLYCPTFINGATIILRTHRI